MNHAILSAVLARANSCPPANAREQFYAVKQHVLSLYGQQIGTDYQRIEKPCWGDWNYGCGDDCQRCGGTGIYSVTIVELERWIYHGRIFHRPVGRIYDARHVNITIHGRIEHRQMKGARHCWCALFMLFSPHFFAYGTRNPEAAEVARKCVRILSAIGLIPKSHVMPPPKEFEPVEVPF